MKRLTALILATLLLFAAGCSGNTDSDETTAEAETVSGGIAVVAKLSDQLTDTATIKSVYVPSQIEELSVPTDTLTSVLPVSGTVKIDKELYYTKFLNSETNELLYVIFNSGAITAYWYTDKWYTKDALDAVTIGSSSDDVTAVDASTPFKLDVALKDGHAVTYHMCDSGYYKFYWEKEKDADAVITASSFVADTTLISLYNLENK